jgi:aspartyl/glutamyl-tRNA(Asn/Gln) amidotransferase C subunit
VPNQLEEYFVAREKKSENEVITKEIFDHLVALGALELPADEAEYLRAELNDQLKAIRELESIEVPDDTPITSHGVPYSEEIRPGLREDRIEICPEADDIVGGAPAVHDRYIVVPEIPFEELE